MDGNNERRNDSKKEMMRVCPASVGGARDRIRATERKANVEACQTTPDNPVHDNFRVEKMLNMNAPRRLATTPILSFMRIRRKKPSWNNCAHGYAV